MAPEHHAFGQAPGPRRHGMVGGKLGQHAGPKIARENRRQGQRHGEAGQYHVMQAVGQVIAVARDREQVEFYAEHNDEHDAEPEGGKAEARRRYEADGVVDGAAAVSRRDGGKRHGYHHGQQHAADDEEQGRGHTFADQPQDVDAVEDGGSHLAVEEILDEVEILQPQGLIEAELRADARDRLGCRFGSEQDAGRIARDCADEGKGDDADAEQHRHQLQGPVEDEAEALHGGPHASLCLARNCSSAG